jgi:predicted deacetylase
VKRHPQLKVTLFTTANWREISALPTRRILSKIPYVKDRVYLAKRWPKDHMRLDRHPEFIEYLNSMKGVEIAYHGLYHCHKGPRIPVEFQDQDEDEILWRLKEMQRIFNTAGLKAYKGICPPGWNAPDNLLNGLMKMKFRYVASARDLFTEVSRKAKTDMSGLKGMSLIYPEMVKDKLVHFSSNFQATSDQDRAREILDLGGLLKVKAHIVKYALGHTSLDGLDRSYANYLDSIFTMIEREYGDRVWWTSMGEISDHIFSSKEDR